MRCFWGKLSLWKKILFSIFIIVIANVLGRFLFNRLPIQSIVEALQLSVSVVAIAWAFSIHIYGKLSELNQISGIDYKQHRNITAEVHSRLTFFWFRALMLVIFALMILAPQIATAGDIQIHVNLIHLAFTGLALAIINLFGLWRDFEEIQDFKNYARELQLLEEQRVRSLDELKRSQPKPTDEFKDGF